MNVFNIGAPKIFVNSFIVGLKKRFNDSTLKNLTIFFPNKLESTIFEKELCSNIELISKIKHIYSLDSFAVNDIKDYNFSKNIFLQPPISLFEQEAIFRDLVFKYCKITNFTQSSTIAKEIIFLMNEINKTESDYFSFEDPTSEKYEKKFIDIFESIINEYQQNLKNIKRSDPLQYVIKTFEHIVSSLQHAPPKDPVVIVVTTISNLSYLKIVKKLLGVKNCYIVLHALDSNIESFEWKNLEKNHQQYGWKIFFENLKLKQSDVLEWDMTVLKDGFFISEVFRASSSIDKWCSREVKREEMIGLKVLEVEDIYSEAQAIVTYIKTLLPSERKIFIASEDDVLTNYLKNFLNFNNIHYQDFCSKGYHNNNKFILFMLFVAVLKEDKKLSTMLSLLLHKKLLPKIFIEDDTNIVSKIISFLDQEHNTEINSLKDDTTVNDILNLKKFLKKINEIKCLNQKLDFNKYLKTHIKIFDEVLSSAEKEIFEEDIEGKKLLEFLDNLMSSAESVEVSSFNEYLHHLEVAAASFTNKICLEDLAVVNFITPAESVFFAGEVIIIPSFIDNLWPSKNKYTTTLVSQQFKNYTNIIDEYKYAGYVSYDLYRIFSSSQVLLTRALYRSGEHTTAARWLTRIKIVASVYDLTNEIYSLEKLKIIAKSYDNNITRQKINPPIAFPNLELRPRKITASRIEMLIKNPYAYYGLTILKLVPSPTIYALEDNKNYGNFVHYVLDYYTKTKFPIKNFSYDDFNELITSFFARNNFSKEKKIFWYLKITNILKWFDEYNKSTSADSKIYSEVSGEYEINIGGAIFKIFARADRIVVNNAKRFIEIIDYKTGTLPQKIDIDNLSEGIQLIVEAIIAKNNGFSDISHLKTPNIKVTYIELKGNELAPTFKEIDFSEKNAIIEQVEKKIVEVFEYYNNALNGYNSKTIYNDYKTDFDHLIRKKEWSSYN